MVAGGIWTRWLAALVFAVLVPGQAGAATIYGTLTRDGKAFANAAVLLNCQQLISAGQADANGNFRLTINAAGRCRLVVDSKSAEVVLGDEPTRRNFDVPGGAGALLVPR